MRKEWTVKVESFQVRSPAQILKPSAAAGAAQLRKTTPEGNLTQIIRESTAHSFSITCFKNARIPTQCLQGMRPQGSQGAKQKLAEFKEQMKRTLNMPG